jgi:phosphate transport system protein
VDVLLVTRNIERIGDHAKNIAENAIFVAEGRDVRHRHDFG